MNFWICFSWSVIQILSDKVQLKWAKVLLFSDKRLTFRPIQKSPCFRSRSPRKLDSVGRIIFFILDYFFGTEYTRKKEAYSISPCREGERKYFFILRCPLIQMNTQDMHASKRHDMPHIVKSQTQHCYIARCTWSKLDTEKLMFLTTVSDQNVIPRSELFKGHKWLVG